VVSLAARSAPIPDHPPFHIQVDSTEYESASAWTQFLEQAGCSDLKLPQKLLFRQTCAYASFRQNIKVRATESEEQDRQDCHNMTFCVVNM